ncbi:hypothetical protein RCJ22_27940 [Vibrio sp. FNV 38]|nr:hypothetical protein [Vibrio sp. FNV 38]
MIFKHTLERATLITLAIFSNYALAAHEETETDLEKVAHELANPNTTMGSLSFNFDWMGYQRSLNSAGSQNGYRMSFQPTLPVPLSERTNLFIRPNIPLIFEQPYYNRGDFDNSGVGLGDVGFDVAVGHTFKNGVIAIGGVVRNTTNSDER